MPKPSTSLLTRVRAGLMTRDGGTCPALVTTDGASPLSDGCTWLPSGQRPGHRHLRGHTSTGAPTRRSTLKR
jgi:hypothetical protein